MTPTATPTGTPQPTETPTPQPTEPPAATATPPGQDIVNITWYAQSMSQSRALPTDVLPGTQITLLLTPKGTYVGTYSGNGGCNSYQGDYQILGPGQIKFLAMNQGQQVCAQDVMDQENTYFSLLINMSQYSTSGTEMTLTNNLGDTINFDQTPAP